MESPDYRPERLERRAGRPIKAISFPDDEIPNLKGKRSFWTTRVSDDFWKYRIGDLVRTPWGGLYAITKEIVVDDIDNHPFLRELTKD